MDNQHFVQSKAEGTCHYCHMRGHYASDCRIKEADKLLKEQQKQSSHQNPKR